MASFMEFESSMLPFQDRQVVVHKVTKQDGFFAIQSIFESHEIRRRLPPGVEPQICIEGDRGKVYLDPDGKVYAPADETELDLLGIIDLAAVQILKKSDLILPLQTETGRRDLPIGRVEIIEISARR